MTHKKYSPELIEEIVEEVVRRLKEGFQTVDVNDYDRGVSFPAPPITKGGKDIPAPKVKGDPKDRPTPLPRVRKGQRYAPGGIEPFIGV